jgi:hypothetical protein
MAPCAGKVMSQKKPVFSERFNDALLKMAMIDEMARADNWQGIDECLAIKPEAIKAFTRYADAAMRAIKQMEKEGIEIASLNLH